MVRGQKYDMKVYMLAYLMIDDIEIDKCIPGNLKLFSGSSSSWNENITELCGFKCPYFWKGDKKVSYVS